MNLLIDLSEYIKETVKSLTTDEKITIYTTFDDTNAGTKK